MITARIERRDRAAAVVDVQVGEQLVAKQPVPLGVQQPVDRPLRQVLLAARHGHVAKPALPLRPPQRHQPTPATLGITTV
jgi:hypothetical protein